jgi:hypothetical protein
MRSFKTMSDDATASHNEAGRYSAKRPYQTNNRRTESCSMKAATQRFVMRSPGDEVEYY